MEKNPFLIVETAIVRRNNPENGLGIYSIVAKTSDSFLYEHQETLETIYSAIMWADMLRGTTMIQKDWISLVKVL